MEDDSDDELLEEIKKTYRKLVKLWHPDRQPPEKREIATRRMQWLNQFYSELLERIKV